MMIRMKIESLLAGAIQRLTGRGRPGETLKKRELFQHYGFKSSPLPGAEGVALKVGNNVLTVATADRRYDVPLENGEVTLFTDEGDKIHFRRGQILELVAGGSITITAPVVTLDAAEVNLNGTAGKLGLVTRGCVCSFTGGPHPDSSAVAFAKKL